MHNKRFPNEAPAYRKKRDELLQAEIELRRQIEQVAALRRALPPGSEVADYTFVADHGAAVSLAELFRPGHNSLIIYSFMFGPNMPSACPSCTSIIDGFDGTAPHLEQQVSLAIVAKSPISRIKEFAAQRGWQNLRLFSSENNGYNTDYLAEDENGGQWPMLNVFKKDNGKIYHTYGTELLYAPSDEGQHPRHVDLLWPVYNLLDLTPQGRGDFNPRLAYV